MQIPQADSVVEIEHKENVQHLIIKRVMRERGTMWRLIVSPLNDVFSNEDTLFWRNEKGEKVPTFVRDLSGEGGDVRFAIVAGEDW